MVEPQPNCILSQILNVHIFLSFEHNFFSDNEEFYSVKCFLLELVNDIQFCLCNNPQFAISQLDLKKKKKHWCHTVRHKITYTSLKFMHETCSI